MHLVHHGGSDHRGGGLLANRHIHGLRDTPAIINTEVLILCDDCFLFSIACFDCNPVDNLAWIPHPGQTTSYTTCTMPVKLHTGGVCGCVYSKACPKFEWSKKIHGKHLETLIRQKKM